jgi:hypothetical protein
MAKQNILPPESRRALDYLHAELAVVLLMADEITGGPCPLEDLPRLASRVLDNYLADSTRAAARELRRVLSRPADELAELGATSPKFFNCYN